MSDDDRSNGDAPKDDPFGDELFSDESSDEAEDRFEAPDSDAVDADAVDDPFAALGEGVDESADPDRNGDGGSEDADASTRADPEPSAPADDPFAELDADAGGTATGEDPFESMEVGDVGEEDVWEALDEEVSTGVDTNEFDDLSADSDEVGDAATRSAGTTAGAAPAGDERVVEKRSYCQRCPHFTAPPETACTHEGTEIVESVDFSRFRVRNCPMVDADNPAFDDE